MTNMTVANTIVTQLGGSRFLAMTGAKNLVGSDNVLTFKLPNRFAKDGINCVRITLNQSDLYDVEFMKIRGMNVQPIAATEDVHVSQLRTTFTYQTGLSLSL